VEINKIYCMDALELLKQIPDQSVDLIITDPPFGCNATLKGNYNDDEDYIKEKIPLWLSELSRVLKENCHIYLYVPTKYVDNWLPEFRKVFKFNNILVCNNMKKGVKYPNMFRNNYQMILYGSKGRARDFNIVDWILTSDAWFYDKRNKKPSRYIYEYPSFIPPYFKATVEESVGHRDEKNTELIKNLIKISSNEGELILDCFFGSGSTLVSAKETARCFIGCDLNIEYCRMAEKRLLQKTLEVKSGCDANDDGIPPNNKLLGILPTIL